MNRIKMFSIAVLTGSMLFVSTQAQAALITFEGLLDLDHVTNQFSAQGATFSNATAAVAPPAGTLNEIDFPPTSGVTVVTNEIDTDADGVPDDLGDISILFDPLAGIDNVSGYFVYSDFSLSGDPLTFSIFGPSDPVNPLATDTLSENLANPFKVSFSGFGTIASLLIHGGSGSYFTLDNLEFSGAAGPGGGTAVPEPATLILFSLGGLGLLSNRNKFSKK